MALLTALRGCARAAMLAALLAAATLEARTLPAQLNEAQVKAGLLYNFVSFVEWPPNASDGVFVIGVYGSDPVTAALQPMHGHVVGGRRIEVRQVEDVTQVHLCHILYVPATRDRELPALLAAARDQPVLTVGEHEEFTHMGGVIRVYAERSRPRLEIDLASAARANLRISARLLGLARVVKDGHVLR